MYAQQKMFLQASAFNQDIGSWNVSNGEDFVSISMKSSLMCWWINISYSSLFLFTRYLHLQSFMFSQAFAFDQNLCRWNKKKSARNVYFCPLGASCGTSICPPSSAPSSPTIQTNTISLSNPPTIQHSQAPTSSPLNHPTSEPTYTESTKYTNQL